MVKRWTKYRLGGGLIEERPVPASELRVMPQGLPERVDLRPWCSPVEDQGLVGSCVANAVVGAMEYLQRRQNLPRTDLSRLFVYYNARALSGWQEQDTGTFVHHGMAAVLAYGACPEAVWPYREDRWAVKPDEASFAAATGFEAVQYARAALGPVAKSVLAAGLPIPFIATLPEQVMYEAGGPGGRVTRPTGEWAPGGGGHSMLIVGYDEPAAAWIVRNSWGADWGDGGHLYIDYNVMERYTDPTSIWVIGGLEAQHGFQLQGLTPAAAQREHVASAPTQMASALAARKAGLREELESGLAAKREGMRDRIRGGGPGAGGGY